MVALILGQRSFSRASFDQHKSAEANAVVLQHRGNMVNRLRNELNGCQTEGTLHAMDISLVRSGDEKAIEVAWNLAPRNCACQRITIM